MDALVDSYVAAYVLFVEFYCNIPGMMVVREAKLTIQQVATYTMMLNKVDTVKVRKKHQEATSTSSKILQLRFLPCLSHVKQSMKLLKLILNLSRTQQMKVGYN